MQAKSLNYYPTTFKFEIELTRDELKHLESLTNLSEQVKRNAGAWYPNSNNPNVGSTTWNGINAMCNMAAIITASEEEWQ